MCFITVGTVYVGSFSQGAAAQVQPRVGFEAGIGMVSVTHTTTVGYAACTVSLAGEAGVRFNPYFAILYRPRVTLGALDFVHFSVWNTLMLEWTVHSDTRGAMIVGVGASFDYWVSQFRTARRRVSDFMWDISLGIDLRFVYAEHASQPGAFVSVGVHPTVVGQDLFLHGVINFGYRH